MAKATMRLGIGMLLVTAVAGGAGYLIGAQRGHQGTIVALQAEAAGNLTQRIEALSLLHLGDPGAVIVQLEGEAEQLARSIASNRGSDRRVLSAMKTYLSVAPRSSETPLDISAALEGVPLLDPSKCSNALKALVLSAHKVPEGR